MEGSYLCRAKNAAGETEDLLQIVVNEKDEGGNDRPGKHDFFIVHRYCDFLNTQWLPSIFDIFFFLI